MKNTYAIGEVCRQLIKVCERIDAMSCGMEQFEQGNDDLLSTYSDLRMDELEHAQILTLKLTELITLEGPEASEAIADEGDGSAFAAGDLTDEKIEKAGNEGHRGGDW